MRSTLFLAALLLTVPSLAQTPKERLDEKRAEVKSLHDRLARHVDATVQFLRDIGPCGEPSAAPVASSTMLHEELEKLPEELDRAHDDLEAARKAAAETLTPQAPDDFRRSVRRSLEAADDMLNKRRDASIAARWLRRVAAERRKSEAHQDLCRILDHVGLPEPFTLSEVREDPLLPLRRLRDAAERHATRRAGALQRGEWSLGLGVMWSPEIDHAGQPVALVAFRPLPEDLPIFRDAAIRPWVQLGTGLEFDEPSYYVGGAVEVGPYLHLGVGWNARRVGDDYDGDLYVAMTVRLERLREWMR
jgi:hypothetical protein